MSNKFLLTIIFVVFLIGGFVGYFVHGVFNPEPIPPAIKDSVSVVQTEIPPVEIKQKGNPIIETKKDDEKV